MGRFCRSVVLLLAIWLGLAGLDLALSATGQARYCLYAGSRPLDLDHLPVVQRNGQLYITVELLERLDGTATAEARKSPSGKPMGGRSSGQDEEPEENAQPSPTLGEWQGSGSYAKLLAPAPAAIPPPKSNRNRYRLAAHVIDVAAESTSFEAEFDGAPIASGALLEIAGQRYIAADVLAQAGLPLTFDASADAYRVIGLIYNIEYSPVSGAKNQPSMNLRCLTPLAAETTKQDDGTTAVILYGGFFADTAGQSFVGDGAVSRIGLKTQPELGRSFLYIKQPKPTGLRVVCDPFVGFARISFGNYLQLVDYAKSSSGEISLNVQMGLPCQVRGEFVDNPPRILVDFPGAIYEDATQTIKVEQGGVRAIRIGTPEPGSVRVVMDLEQPLDYRILGNSASAKYYIQLLPRTTPQAPRGERRAGRTVMLDPGHGGTDPGAPGIISGVWEAALNLQITNKLATELEQKGYKVLLTRERDRFTSLGARSDYANDVLPYVFVSVHCNSIEDPAFQGLMTFCHPTSTQGRSLAELIHRETIAATGAVDKGVRTANFFVLRETVMPSVLVECGFVTNGEECRKLTNPDYQQRLASGIAAGVDAYITGAF